MTIAFLNNFLGPDSMIIFLVILLLFGAKKLPELARGMGQAVREFSKAKDEIEREVNRPPTPEPPKSLDQPKPDIATDTIHHETTVEEGHQDHHDETHVA